MRHIFTLAWVLPSLPPLTLHGGRGGGGGVSEVVGGAGVCARAAGNPMSFPITVRDGEEAKRTLRLLLISMSQYPQSYTRAWHGQTLCINAPNFVHQEIEKTRFDGTYRNREPVALSEAVQPRKLTTSAASEWHLCVLPALKPSKKQSTSQMQRKKKTEQQRCQFHNPTLTRLIFPRIIPQKDELEQLMERLDPWLVSVTVR